MKSFVTLRANPQYVAEIASWIDAEWGRFSGRSPEATHARFEQETTLNSLEIPTTILAVEDGQALGCATLRHKDSFDWDPVAAPWVCNVYVHANARGQGLAQQLLKYLLNEAKKRQYSSVYLACADHLVRLYESVGFSVYARAAHAHGDQNLMRANL